MLENRLLSISMATTMALHGVLIAMVVVPPSCGASEADAKSSISDDDMVIIEAAIAYKKQEVPKQPQKQRSATPKKKDKVGISRDADQPVDPDKKKKEDEIPDYRQFLDDHQEDESDLPVDPDLEPGPATPRAGGAFDGKEYGWADENKGHPYMQELVRQVDFVVPTLEKGKGHAVACIRLNPDGTISDTNLRTPSGNTNIDRAAEETLTKLRKAREDPSKVEPVPSELVPITNKWLCFKLGL